MFKKIKKWLYSYPDPDNWFGVNLRETVQAIFPCKHDWEYSDDRFRRECKKCWKQQKLYYYCYGPIRSEWCDYDIRKL